jgi:hypothetical protein
MALGSATELPSQRVDSVPAGPKKAVAPVSPAPKQAARDSTKPPISPRRAFLYSLVMPGLGQSRLRRSGAGAVYFFFEGLSFAMATKSLYDLGIAKEHRHDAIVTAYKPQDAGASGAPVPADTLRNRYLGNRVKSRRTHVEDWAAALVFNHLFSGADAFVSAQLWDLPIQIGFRAAPAIGILRATRRY